MNWSVCSAPEFWPESRTGFFAPPVTGCTVAQDRDSVYIWITWLSKVMAGEQTCEWASWFKAHKTYAKLPNDFDLAAWTIEHTKRLRELRIELQRAGETVSVEGENSIRYALPSGAVIAGKPDLIGVSSKGTTIYDIKTGQPKTSDTIQVMIYMYLVPLTVGRFKNVKPAGCVVYGTTRVPIPSTAVDDKFKEQFSYFLEIVAGANEPLKTPGPNECRFCDISQTDCPDRHQTIVASEL
jgi:PD-(D/E)XK nuclease superfamily